MFEIFSSNIFYYTMIAIGFQFNSKIRIVLNKYYMQDILKVPCKITNRLQHINDAISSFAKIFISLTSDSILGPYYTIIIIFPLYFIFFIINIFSSVYSQYYLYIITFNIGTMIGGAIFTVFISFVKDQLLTKDTFDRFLDMWYVIFNITIAFKFFIITFLFKSIVSNNYNLINLLLFFIPPLIISFITFIIFYYYKSKYIIKIIERRNIFKYFIMFFKKDNNLSEIQN